MTAVSNGLNITRLRQRTCRSVDAGITSDDKCERCVGLTCRIQPRPFCTPCHTAHSLTHTAVVKNYSWRMVCVLIDTRRAQMFAAITQHCHINILRWRHHTRCLCHRSEGIRRYVYSANTERICVTLACRSLNRFYRAMHYSAKRGLAIACCSSVCLSVCDVDGSGPHRLKILDIIARLISPTSSLFVSQRLSTYTHRGTWRNFEEKMFVHSLRP